MTKFILETDHYHIAYHVRLSHKAKRIRLHVSQPDHVNVIIPKGFDPQGIPAILQAKQTWLLKTWHDLQTGQLSAPASFPRVIDLLAIDQQWQVTYETWHESLDQPAHLEQNDYLLILRGSPHWEYYQKPLQGWLKQRAADYLLPWLKDVSQTLGLSYVHASIRGQKTRWGSCSSQRKISLNYKLLFLPKDQVRYVLIHELCHIIHLNHSSQFWQLVKSFEPNYLRLRRDLRLSYRWIPNWLEAS
ncbi:MAG: SprT family zinc-dependent metalloprotease [Cyanobacteriota bacterium]|nr:SprT family zinc-dependent metalloprotease [Cyanobacteriota bacterium]